MRIIVRLYSIGLYWIFFIRIRNKPGETSTESTLAVCASILSSGSRANRGSWTENVYYWSMVVVETLRPIRIESLRHENSVVCLIKIINSFCNSIRYWPCTQRGLVHSTLWRVRSLLPSPIDRLVRLGRMSSISERGQTTIHEIETI